MEFIQLHLFLVIRLAAVVIIGFNHLGSNNLFGQAYQSDSVDEFSPLVLQADARDEYIRLRWAPRDFDLWVHANQYGYQLERYNSARPDEIQMLGNNFQPEALAIWEPIADTLEMAMLYAGALYSPDFMNPSLTDEGAITEQDRQAMEDYRFGLSLFAADQHFEIALAAGLAFEDRELEAGQAYVYRLSINGLPEDKSVELEVIVDQRIALLPPAELQANWATDQVQLFWDQSQTQYQYSSYQLECSIASGPWEKVNKFPLVYFALEDNPDPRIYYEDSLQNNSLEYRYRLRGRSYFGVDGPWGSTISGHGVLGPMPYQASIKQLVQTNENGLRIEWEFPASGDDQLVGFKIYRSRQAYEQEELISPQMLGPDTRLFFDPEPKSGRFYSIVAVDQNGYEIVGTPKLLVLEDNDPPAPPIGLAGVMDSTGLVQLNWLPNSELDHQGYRVYISNQREGHFIQLTADAISTINFEHQVTMETIAETVYFKLKAIDYYGNYSELSEVVAVERPDLQPPGPANIREIEGQEEGIYISWSLSPSDDVVLYQLQRRPATLNEQRWELVFENSISEESVPGQDFFDVNTQAGRSYQYRLLVTDDAGLFTASRPSTATRIDNGSRGLITDFVADQQENGSVVLAFNCIYPVDPTFFQLYRAKNGEALTTYLQLTPDDPRLQAVGPQQYQLRDSDVKEGDTVNYRILARYADGGFSNLAEVRIE